MLDALGHILLKVKKKLPYFHKAHILLYWFYFYKEREEISKDWLYKHNLFASFKT